MSSATGNAMPTSEALAGGVAVIPPPTTSAPLSDTKSPSLTLDPSSDVTDHTDDTKDLAFSHPPSPISPLTPPPLSTARLIVIAAIVTCTMCLGAAGAMGLIISLPVIQVDLDMRETDLQWVSSVYSLTAGCFLLLSGRIADIFGRKKVFVAGVAWNAIWSLIGGFMKNGTALIITRAFAGMGNAMSTPSAIGIIASNFKGRARSSAFAAFSAGAPVGGAIGLVIGGMLTSYTPQTWRAVLWTLSSFSFLIGTCGFFFVPNDPALTNDKRVDWIGAALVTVGLIMVMFVISGGEAAPQGWRTGYIIALLIIGIVLVAAFFFWERHVINNTTRPPLMRLKLWTRAKGRLASVYAIGFISWMGFSALFYQATLFYQQVQDTGTLGAMLRFLPTSISGVLCNVLVAWLVNKVNTQWIICTGILSTAIASMLFALSPKDVDYWRLPFNGMWMAVLGADFLMATGSIFVSALALPEEQSVAGAVFQTLIQLGGSFGIALTTVISAIYNQKALDAGREKVDAQLEGLHAAFWLGASFSLLALVIAAVMLRGMGAIGKEKKKAVQVKPEELDEVSPLPEVNKRSGGLGGGEGVMGSEKV